MSRFTSNQKMLDAVSVDSTSVAFDVSMRSKLSATIDLANAVGSGTVGFSVSNDGTNFVAYNRIDSNVTDSNTQNDTRVATITVNTAGPDAIALFPASDYFRYIKAIYTTVTGAIVTSEIGNAGSGYSANDVLTVADGTGGTITVLTVDGGGVVLTYELTTAGTDYSIATHNTTGGGGTGFTLSILTVNGGDCTVTLQNID